MIDDIGVMLIDSIEDAASATRKLLVVLISYMFFYLLKSSNLTDAVFFQQT